MYNNFLLIYFQSNVEEELDRIKQFNADAIAQGKQLEDVRRTARQFAESLKELGADDQALKDIEDSVMEFAERLAAVTTDTTAKSNELQTALVESQGVQEGLDSILAWMKEAEGNMNRMKPISLSQDGLNNQIQELQMMRTDLESHLPSVESVNKSGLEMMKSCSDPRKARAMDNKLKDLNARIDQLAIRCKERGEDVEEVIEKLADYNEGVRRCKEWLEPMLKTLNSPATSELDTQLYKEKIAEIADDAKHKKGDMVALRRAGRLLIESDKTGNVGPVKDSLEKLEKSWEDFQDALEQKQKEADVREQQSNKYDEQRADVTAWLFNMENTVDNLDPVAIDVEVIEVQVEELKVGSKFYTPILLLPQLIPSTEILLVN